MLRNDILERMSRAAEIRAMDKTRWFPVAMVALALSSGIALMLAISALVALRP